MKYIFRFKLWWSLPRIANGFPYVSLNVPLYKLRWFCFKVSMRVRLRPAMRIIKRLSSRWLRWLDSGSEASNVVSAVLLGLFVGLALALLWWIVSSLPQLAAARPASPGVPALLASLPLFSRSWVIRGRVGLGAMLGGFFGCRVCAIRSCSCPARCRMIGRKGLVRLFPSSDGLGLCFSPGCAFPVFLVLPSGVLVPFVSCLAGSSFLSPVCAGRVVCWCRYAAPTTNKGRVLFSKIYFFFFCYMSTIRNFKSGRNIPNPQERSSWNFRLWSYGFMRPLHAIPHSIIVTNVPQSILDIFIPANTWAQFKRLIIWADIKYTQNGPPHPGGRKIGEFSDLQSIGLWPRGGVQPIADSAAQTRYVIQRQYQYEGGTEVYEENWNIQGNTTFGAAANSDHRSIPFAPIAAYNNGADAYLQLFISNTYALSTDTCEVHTAQAYIQAPLNLNRLPQ